MAETVAHAAENVATVAANAAVDTLKGAENTAHSTVTGAEKAAEADLTGVVGRAEDGTTVVKSKLIHSIVTIEGELKSKYHKLYLYLGNVLAYIGGKFNTGAHKLFAMSVTK
jgi:hypothetical protein